MRRDVEEVHELSRWPDAPISLREGRGSREQARKVGLRGRMGVELR